MASQFGEGDLGIVNYALTLEYLETAFYNDAARSGLFKGDDLALIKHIARHRAAARRRAHRDGEEARRPAGQGAEGRVPAQGPEVGPEAGGDGREPRRRRLPRPGGEHRVARHPRGGALDPLGRGAPRGGAQRAHRRGADARTGRSPRPPTCRKSSTRCSRSSSRRGERKETTINEFGTREDRGRGPQPQHAADARRARRGCALRHRGGHAAGPAGVRAGLDGRHRHPQLRAHARVPRGRLLRGRREDARA